MHHSPAEVRDRLLIDDLRYVEIESKKRVVPEQLKDIKKYLLKRKNVRLEKKAFFFDQFLDTPRMELFQRGASLRLRYKRNGTKVYMQYKGPGFLAEGLLYRSEFSTNRLTHVTMEESHHDVIHFTRTSVQNIFRRHTPSAMAKAMRLHLGADTVGRISVGAILCAYQKNKFLVKRGAATLEPSLDQVFAFHINRKGMHPLSTFCEYENEIKSDTSSFAVKMAHLDELLDFDARVEDEFGLPAERLDKYHRCATIFMGHR